MKMRKMFLLNKADSLLCLHDQCNLVMIEIWSQLRGCVCMTVKRGWANKLSILKCYLGRHSFVKFVYILCSCSSPYFCHQILIWNSFVHFQLLFIRTSLRDYSLVPQSWNLFHTRFVLFGQNKKQVFNMHAIKCP